MLWPIVGFAIGLLAGVLGTLGWHRHRVRLTAIEITNLEYEINYLRDFNSYCLSHAAGVLLTWEDYKESHGID